MEEQLFLKTVAGSWGSTTANQNSFRFACLAPSSGRLTDGMAVWTTIAAPD